MDQFQGARLDGVSTNHLYARNWPINAAGQIGNAAQFNGSSHWMVRTNNSISTALTGDFTIRAWLWLDNTETNGVAVSTERTGAYLGFGPGYGGGMTGSLWNFGMKTSSGWIQATSAGIPTIGSWYYVVGWYDSTAGKKCIQVVAASGSYPGTIDTNAQSSAITATGQPFNVGTWEEGVNNQWPGRIDEIAIWTRVLTDAERGQDWTNGVNGTALVASPILSTIYVSTNGTADAFGSLLDPLDIANALDRSTTRVQPGGTIAMLSADIHHRHQHQLFTPGHPAMRP